MDVSQWAFKEERPLASGSAFGEWPRAERNRR